MIDQQAQRKISRKWIIILMTGLWSLILTSCQSPQSTGQESPSVAQMRATIDYWNGLFELNLQLNQRASELGASVEKDGQNGSALAEILPKLAEDFSALDDAYAASIMKMSVLNVDERLVKETADDLRSGNELVKHLKGMADAAVAYANWNQRKNNPEGAKIFSDIVYSFLGGLTGRPLAGYDKLNAEKASVDSEGQQILGAYLVHAQALNSIIEQERADDIKELELRAYLAKKYGVEFKPMPKPGSDSHAN